MINDRSRRYGSASRLARILCAVYFVLLLLVFFFIGNPLKFVDGPRIVNAYKSVEPALHVSLFALLALLVCASRLQIQVLAQAGFLVLVAASTELVQIWLPNRTPRFGCFVQDVVGLIVGVIAWFMIVDLLNTIRRVLDPRR